MATERVIEREVPTTTVVERDGGGGGMGMAMVAILVLAVLLIGGFFVLNANRNDSLRTAAVSDAASSVGAAADNVGKAAGDVAKSVTPN